MPNFSTQCDINQDEPDIEAIEADVGDISHARLKLDDLLNEIVDRNEDCLSTDEENQKQNVTGGVGTSSSNTSAAKRLYTHKAPRKKKKKDHPMHYGDGQRASYIIKLFDRELDLAKFEDGTTLYAMLREWMKNGQMVKSDESPDFNFSESAVPPHEIVPVGEKNSNHPEFLYELPKPLKSDELCAYPRPLPPALKTAMIEDIINTESNIEELRKDNMLRWRKVKNRWKEHSIRQQRRNMPSLLILKDMFTRQTSKLV